MDSATRDQNRCLLAAEALRSWGVLKLCATGVSMLPTLWPGDILTVQSASPEQVELGEIVLYMRQNRFFVHRIVRKDITRDEPAVVTRGDCMSENDPAVGRCELLGKIVQVKRPSSIFVPVRKLSPFRRLLAFLLCHWSLFRRAGLRLHADRRENDDQIEATFANAA
jgi:signal peptidase I